MRRGEGKCKCRGRSPAHCGHWGARVALGRGWEGRSLTASPRALTSEAFKKDSLIQLSFSFFFWFFKYLLTIPCIPGTDLWLYSYDVDKMLVPWALGGPPMMRQLGLSFTLASLSRASRCSQASLGHRSLWLPSWRQAAGQLVGLPGCSGLAKGETGLLCLFAAPRE